MSRGAVILGLCDVLGTNCYGAIIHVPADQACIQCAIGAAHNGDVVLVAPGIYYENISYEGKAISIESEAGPAKTVIDGGGSDTAVRFEMNEGPQSALVGFTIQHGNGNFGGGISLDLTSPTITENIFRYNSKNLGAAINGNSSSPIIQRNIFFGNICDNQFSSGIIHFGNFSSPVIVDNVFIENPCLAINIILPEGTFPVVANNTFIHNHGGVKVDGQAVTASHVYANNILVGNTFGLKVEDLLPGNQPPPWSHNLVFLNTTDYVGIPDPTGTNGNISVDPLFLPTSSRHSFQLDRRSPAIDAGTLSVPDLPSIDFLGNPRVVDGDGNGSALPDIGAYEFIPEMFGLTEQLDISRRK